MVSFSKHENFLEFYNCCHLFCNYDVYETHIMPKKSIIIWMQKGANIKTFIRYMIFWFQLNKDFHGLIMWITSLIQFGIFFLHWKNFFYTQQLKWIGQIALHLKLKYTHSFPRVAFFCICCAAVTPLFIFTILWIIFLVVLSLLSLSSWVPLFPQMCKV